MQKSLLIVLVMASLLPGLVFAQRTNTSISGTVTDPSGGVVPGAQVTAIETSTGTASSIEASSDGFYIVTNLRPGTYRLRVEQAGFETYIREGIVLEVDRPVSIDVELQVGSNAQSVTVSGTAPQVDLRTGELNSVVTGAMAVDLPLNGRNVLQLMALSPDVSPSVPGGYTSVYAQIAIRPEATSVFDSASGGRGNSTGFYLDGGINEDTYDQVSNVYPNPDAIQEFSYETNNYSARYGGRGGGIVNAVTRSGANQFHATAFEFVRNGALNARNFFAPASDGLKRNQYGFTVGGPVQRDKMFFFFDWQGTKLRSAPTSNEATTITAAELEDGDFSAISKQLVDPGTGLPFKGNQVPTTDFDPVAVKVADLLPLGAPPTGIAYYTSYTINNDNQLVARVDRTFGNKLRFFARYLYDDLGIPARPILSDLLTAAMNVTYKSQNITLNAEYLLRPNLITTLTATYNREMPMEKGAPGFPSWTQVGVDIPDLNVYPNNTSPTMTLGGGFKTTWLGFYRFPGTESHFDNNWTYIRAGHTLQFGADVKYHERATGDQDYHGEGRFQFQGGLSGSNLLDFMLGFPSEFDQSLCTEYNFQRDVPALYANDAWKVGRRLTLNLGVRWNPWVPLAETTGNKLSIFSQASYNEGVESTRFPLSPPGLLFAGDPGVPGTGTKANYHVFDPRIGFAYDPFGDGKTAIRGGYGIFHDEPMANAYNGTASSVPFYTTSTISYPASLDNPYSTKGYPDPFLSPINFATEAWPEPFSGFALDPHITYPTIQQWNLTLERQVTPSLMLRTAYEASESYHMFMAVEANSAVYIAGQSTLQNVQSRRPMPQFSNLAIGDTIGTASYNSLLISAEKRMSHGLSLNAGFRWAKSLDEASQCEFEENVDDPYNIRSSRGLSDYNVGKQFILSFLYGLPTFRSLGFVGRQLLGGWHANGIVTARSGFPFTVLSGKANSMTGGESGLERADLVGNPRLASDRPLAQRLSEWFNPAAFSYNAVGTFGNSPRNAFIGPGYADVDFGVVRSFRIPKGHFAETQRIDFRAEFFNLFNRANFNNPQKDAPQVSQGSSMATIVSAYDPRILQFALKYIF